MRLDDLIAALQMHREHGATGNEIVMAFDGDSGQIEEVTGFLLDADKSLEFCTDDND